MTSGEYALDEIVALINQVKDREDISIGSAGPQDDATVSLLEEALGIPLPASYRRFVKLYGYLGGLNDYDVLGIDGAHKLDGGAYHATIRARVDFELALPFIVIEFGAEPDEIVCLNSSKADNEGEYPVVGYDSRYHDTWPLADNFGLYLKTQLTNLVEDIFLENPNTR